VSVRSLVEVGHHLSGRVVAIENVDQKGSVEEGHQS
jgi:hypothetical protein